MIYRDGSSGKSLSRKIQTLRSGFRFSQQANFNFRSFCLFRCLIFRKTIARKKMDKSDLPNFPPETMLDPFEFI